MHTHIHSLKWPSPTRALCINSTLPAGFLNVAAPLPEGGKALPLLFPILPYSISHWCLCIAFPHIPNFPNRKCNVLEVYYNTKEFL